MQPQFSFQKAGWRQTNSETQGVGIGLSTANSLCQALGGKLCFEINQEQK